MYVKLRRSIEPRWCSEYVAKFYADFPQIPRCPLGPIPPELEEYYGVEKARRIYRPSRPEVDYVVKLPEKLLMIEAKIFKYMDGLSKLPIYASLVPKTPELREYWTKPVEMHLLIPHKIPWVIEAGKANNIKVIIWAPDWVRKIWEERDKYWTREARYKREKRKALLRRLGYV